MRSDQPVNLHLPPHLREVCDLLACGLVRLRSRSIEEHAREPEGDGEFRLQPTARQRRHAKPNREGRA